MTKNELRSHHDEELIKELKRIGCSIKDTPQRGTTSNVFDNLMVIYIPGIVCLGFFSICLMLNENSIEVIGYILRGLLSSLFVGFLVLVFLAKPATAAVVVFGSPIWVPLYAYDKLIEAAKKEQI